jgi:hypothetical protein
MDLLELKKYFDGKISARDFVDSERENLLAYIKNTREKTKSISVPAEHEEFFDGYDSDNIRLLLKDYLKDELLEWDLDYIVQALDMLDEEPEDERARYVVSCLSTPEIDIPISREEVSELLKYLETHSEPKKVNLRENPGRSNYRSIVFN